MSADRALPQIGEVKLKVLYLINEQRGKFLLQSLIVVYIRLYGP